MLGLVLLIWGWIGYRVVSGGTNRPVSSVPAHVSVSGREPTVNRDYELSLRYRDPFLGNPAPHLEDESMHTEEQPAYQGEEMQEYIDWSFIEYNGVISSADGNRHVSLIRINGRDVMLKAGQTTAEVTLVRNHGGYVTVRYRNQLQTIPLGTQKNDDENLYNGMGMDSMPDDGLQ